MFRKWSFLLLFPLGMSLSCARSAVPAAGCETDAECDDDLKCFDNVCALGPRLLTSSPLNFGDSPKGVRAGGRLVITNGGDVTLKITDYELTPDNDVFVVDVSSLPVELKGKQSLEIPMLFLPPAEQTYEAELHFESNHDGTPPDGIKLVGTGLSDVVCVPCVPGPEPECHFENTSSISYLPTSDVSCDDGEDYCAYRVVETICETQCDPNTGLCPNVAPPELNWDAGTPPAPPEDAGMPPGACSHSILAGDDCDDGDACTQNDVCTDGTCTGSPPLHGASGRSLPQRRDAPALRPNLRLPPRHLSLRLPRHALRKRLHCRPLPGRHAASSLSNSNQPG